MKKNLLIVSFLLFSLTASAQNTSQSYIQKFKDNAIRIMHETGIPASIVLAVAMHESGCGNSLLAREFNNQFGIKGYTANILYRGNNKKAHTFYKKYDSVMDSFEDFARIVTDRKQFSHLSRRLSHSDYVGWAKGIQRSGYASSRRWASQVLGLVRKYNLNLFDEMPAEGPQIVSTAP